MPAPLHGVGVRPDDVVIPADADRLHVNQLPPFFTQGVELGYQRIRRIFGMIAWWNLARVRDLIFSHIGLDKRREIFPSLHQIFQKYCPQIKQVSTDFLRRLASTIFAVRLFLFL